MKIEKVFYDNTKDGREIYKFILTNKKKTRVEIINYGASITSFIVEDKEGNLKDIVLGYDNLLDYQEGKKSIGVTVGRHANRIKGASFKLNGEVYKLNPNIGEHQLHGGETGFQKRVWDYEVKENSMVFKYTSGDGEEGYPGECTLEVEFILNDENELHINYRGTTDKDTLLNPTNHSYFNLNGHNSGDVLNHKLQVNAEEYLPIDESSIPLGYKEKVKGTDFDLNTSKRIGDIIVSQDKQIVGVNGLDHTFCLDERKELKLASTLYNDDNSIGLFTYTDLPGIQVYIGNFLGKVEGKQGAIYENYSGICLETQYYPNSINVEEFESPILRAGDVFKSTTIYKIV